MVEKIITTRIVLTHDEYANLASKTLKAGEAVLAKVGTTQAPGEVAQPIWMMKIGDGTSTVEACPWLVAPAADVYEWAKKSALAVEDVPTLPIAKIEGLTDALAGKADSDHNHDEVYKKLQTAVAEAGAANKTLKISQNENGEITVTLVDIAITSAQVTDFENKVDSIVTNMGIAGDEEVAELAGRVATLEGIDHTVYAKTSDVNAALEDKVDADTYATDKAALKAADADLDTAVKAAQADATAAKNAIEAFLDENAATDDVVNTLKEIQAGLDAGEASAASLLAEVNKIKYGTTVVPKATDADTVDGKHADDFATKEQGAKADTALQAADITGLREDITDLQNNKQDKITGTQHNVLMFGEDGAPTDSGISAGDIADVVGRVNAEFEDVQEAANAAIKGVTADAATGLKVTTTDGVANISFLDDVVFVLNGGTADNLN